MTLGGGALGKDLCGRYRGGVRWIIGGKKIGRISQIIIPSTGLKGIV